MSNCCTNSSKATPVSTASNCPECGGAGKLVKTVTLKHMAKQDFLDAVGKPGFLFCARSNCGVVYFHPDGDRLEKKDVRVRVGLKEMEDPVPICYCFGFSEAMVRNEVETTGACTIPGRISAEVKAQHCACEVRNPQGSCCLGNVNAVVKKAMKAIMPRSSVALS